MAKRRMISVDVIETDRFANLPFSSQVMYLHMIMNADDDGFVANVGGLLRIYGIQKKYYRELVKCGYVIDFDSGVAVLSDWRRMNRVRGDRYIATDYQEEYKSLTTDEKDRYIKA